MPSEDVIVPEPTIDIIPSTPLSVSFSDNSLNDPNNSDLFTEPSSTIQFSASSGCTLPTKPPKKPPCSKFLTVLDNKTHTEKSVNLSTIGNERIVIDVAILELMFSKSLQCKFFHHGPVKLYRTSAVHGFGLFLKLRCDYCFVTTNGLLVSIREFSSQISVGSFSVSKRNDSVYQAVLGARLAGIGKRGLDFIFCTLRIGRPLSYTNFSKTNRDLLVAVEHIANESMQKAIVQLRELNGLMPDVMVHIIVSYDGAYQKRSSKMGGGFSRFCFVSIIDMSTGQVSSGL